MESGSRVGIKPTLYKPLLAAVNHHLSLQRWKLHIKDFLQKPWVLLLVVEFNILVFIMIYTQKRTPLNPGPAPALPTASAFTTATEEVWGFLSNSKLLFLSGPERPITFTTVVLKKLIVGKCSSSAATAWGGLIARGGRAGCC